VVPRGLRISPAEAVQTWLQVAGIAEGPPPAPGVHRGGYVCAWGQRGGDVALIGTARATQTGLDPAEFSGHRLRAGFGTSAAETGRVS
jgi:hypothetical protein